MGALLREANIRDTDKSIVLLAKHLLTKYGLGSAIEALDVQKVRAALTYPPENVIRPSNYDPVSRVLRARLIQLGIHPNTDLVGRIIYILFNNMQFEAWCDSLRQNQFNELWDILQSGNNNTPRISSKHPKEETVTAKPIVPDEKPFVNAEAVVAPGSNVTSPSKAKDKAEINDENQGSLKL
jgi:hypothetical protein